MTVKKIRHSTGRMPWSIRAVQLDLARHMETPDYICRYADFTAKHGFNFLVLYLEGRVKTKSFPYRANAESYSLKDMEQVVKHAGRAGMEVVPAVSTLGHGEQFLAYKQLAHLAEERDGKARFGNPSPFVFCPSLDATYDFFEKYFRELSEVFKSPHFHVGLDEDWNMGYCHLCRERWTTEGLNGIFTRHVHKTHQILNKLGKRMWFWDDMYEMFPDDVKNIPQDAVLCHWQYDEQIEPEGIQAHFANRYRKNWLAEYEARGLNVLICPWDKHPQNIATFTNYARRHKVLGGLLTQWEGSPRLHAGQPAIVAFTGALWNDRQFDAERALEQGVRAVLPAAQPCLVAAVKELLRYRRNFPNPTIQNYLYGLKSRDELLIASVLHLALNQIRTERALAQPRAQEENNFLDHLEWDAEMELLHWELRDLIPAILHPKRPLGDVPALKQRVEAWRNKFGELLKFRDKNAARLHLNEHHHDQRVEKHLKSVVQGLQPVWQRLSRQPASKDWILILRLFLQDYYGAQKLKITATAGAKRQVIAQSVFKHATFVQGHMGGYYDVYLPFVSESVPDGICLETWGYGGQGVAFLELQNPNLILLPACIRGATGSISRPEAVLRDDSAYAYLGWRDILSALHNPGLAEHRAVLDIGMRRW